MEVTIRGIQVCLRREHLEVMERVARGMTYREIGAELGLSRDGVERRVRAACCATGASNRVECVVLLFQAGVIR